MSHCMHIKPSTAPFGGNSRDPDSACGDLPPDPPPMSGSSRPILRGLGLGSLTGGGAGCRGLVPVRTGCEGAVPGAAAAAHHPNRGLAHRRGALTAGSVPRATQTLNPHGWSCDDPLSPSAISCRPVSGDSNLVRIRTESPISSLRRSIGEGAPLSNWTLDPIP